MTVRVCDGECSDANCVLDALREMVTDAVLVNEGLSEALADAEADGDAACVSVCTWERDRVRLREAEATCERVAETVGGWLRDAERREAVTLGLREPLGDRSWLGDPDRLFVCVRLGVDVALRVRPWLGVPVALGVIT